MDRKANDPFRIGKAIGVMVAGMASLFMAMPAMATCSVGSTVTIALPLSLQVPRNATPGQVIWDSNWIDSGSNTITCTSVTDARLSGYATAQVAVPGFGNVFESGIPGIGMKSAAILGSARPADINAGEVMQWPNTAPVVIGTGTFDFRGAVRFQYVVTGPVSTGTSNIGVFLGGFQTTGQPGGLSIGIGNGRASTVTASACTVQNPTFTVAVPKAKASDFGAIGSTAGQGTFNLSLNCPAGVSAAVTFTDVTNPTNRTTNLTLSPDSSASGLAYQISQGAHVVAYGPDSANYGTQNQFQIGSVSAPGSTDVPFTVQYVKMGKIVPGSVNAKATFTLSYK